MECIVHFHVIYPHVRKTLRGLVVVKEHSSPSLQQMINMFKKMEFDVYIDNEDRMIFKPEDPSAGYEYIHVFQIDTSNESFQQDKELIALLKHIVPSKI